MALKETQQGNPMLIDGGNQANVEDESHTEEDGLLYILTLQKEGNDDIELH